MELPARSPDLYKKKEKFFPLRSLGRRRSRRRKFSVVNFCGRTSRTLVTPSPLTPFSVLFSPYRAVNSLRYKTQSFNAVGDDYRCLL